MPPQSSLIILVCPINHKQRSLKDVIYSRTSHPVAGPGTGCPWNMTAALSCLWRGFRTPANSANWRSMEGVWVWFDSKTPSLLKSRRGWFRKDCYYYYEFSGGKYCTYAGWNYFCRVAVMICNAVVSHISIALIAVQARCLYIQVHFSCEWEPLFEWGMRKAGWRNRCRTSTSHFPA